MTSPVSKPKLMAARITKRVDVTHDLWKIWVKPETPFGFKPGQYCTIGVDGLERPYSIVSAPYEDEIELFIELVPLPDGRLTPVLHDLGEGAELTIRPRAKGLFLFKEDYRDHLMVSTVTGVVPYVSILRQYLHEGREGHRFFLLVGASYHDEFTYDGELARLAAEYPDFIKFVPTISRPGEEKNASWTGETGRVNTIVGKYVQEFGLKPENTLIYACGHPGMIEDVKVHAAEIGFDFQEERFWKEDDQGPLGSRAVPRSMTTYKGNAGNLMQHWTLCELLVIARKHASGLSFIDAHAMAPLARECPSPDSKFSSVQARLPGQKSTYEQAWHRLAPRGGYPNSAAFVKDVWNGDFSLLLCETDPSTIREIKPWLKRVEKSELSQGDWRKRFDEGLPSPSEVGLKDDSLTLVSFDPYMYIWRQLTKPMTEEQTGNLYPDDIKLGLCAMSSLKGKVLIQLSTYSAQNNSQKDVIASLNESLEPGAFKLCAVVWVKKQMMSLVYARNVS